MMAYDAENAYRTPSLSMTPSSEVKSKADFGDNMHTGIQMSLMKRKIISFKGQRQKDRMSVGHAIARALKGRYKRDSLTADENWQAIKESWDRFTTQREENGEGSVRLTFPDQFNWDDEEMWLKKRFRPLLQVNVRTSQRHDQDQDDEEDLPVRRSGVKVQPAASEEIEMESEPPAKRRSNLSYAEDSGDEDTTEAEDEDGSEEESGPMPCETCSRGLSIRHGDLQPDRMEAEHPGLAVDRSSQQATKRRWVWIDGALKVWPAF